MVERLLALFSAWINGSVRSEAVEDGIEEAFILFVLFIVLLRNAKRISRAIEVAVVIILFDDGRR